MLRRVVACLVLTACGGILSASGDDEEDAPRPNDAADASDGEAATGAEGGVGVSGEAGSAGDGGAGEAGEGGPSGVWVCFTGSPQPNGPYGSLAACMTGRTSFCAASVKPGDPCIVGEPARKYCSACAEDGVTPNTFYFGMSSCSCPAPI